MITTPKDYLEYLHLIQNENFPTQAILLPTNENIYEIDLNTRSIQAPEILSAQRDHHAETVYFKVDRYFDNMDLTKTVCIVDVLVAFSGEVNDEGNKYLYSLNTQTATSKVLHGMNVITDENEYFIVPEAENFAKYVL